MVAANARQSLNAQGIANARLFITPAPLTTLLWRVVARTEGGFYEGFDSVVANDGPIEFSFYPSDDRILTAALPHVPAAQRLQWFANGFVGASAEDDTLIMTDLKLKLFDAFLDANDVLFKSGLIVLELSDLLL